MPAKKKHTKGKGSFQGNQRRPEQRAQQPTTGQAQQAGKTGQAAPATAAMAFAPAAQRPAPRAVPAKFKELNISSEIRSIGILFVVVLAIMVTLSLLLR
jgi:hypothetical protein